MWTLSRSLRLNNQLQEPTSGTVLTTQDAHRYRDYLPLARKLFWMRSGGTLWWRSPALAKEPATEGQRERGKETPHNKTSLVQVWSPLHVYFWKSLQVIHPFARATFDLLTFPPFTAQQLESKAGHLVLKPTQYGLIRFPWDNRGPLSETPPRLLVSKCSRPPWRDQWRVAAS